MKRWRVRPGANARRVSIGLLAAWTLAATAGPPATAPSRRPALPPRCRDPYQGAILVNGQTGEVLLRDGADEPGYPASMLKLMNLLLVLERIEAGALTLDTPVRVPREAMQIGGSQVYLDEKEQFTVEELLYALMVQSANDAAAALAIHIAGSREGFVRLMNERAQQLGMTATVFHSVHGLPPGPGQKPDVTTARDFASLAVELLKHPAALQYTSTRERVFRPEKPFVMRNHNRLLDSFPGCDGLKTGYYRAAGYSVCATALRQGVRLVAVILGSADKETCAEQAAQWLERGFKAVRTPPAESKPRNPPAGAG